VKKKTNLGFGVKCCQNHGFTVVKSLSRDLRATRELSLFIAMFFQYLYLFILFSTQLSADIPFVDAYTNIETGW